jgi:hypothetical protein
MKQFEEVELGIESIESSLMNKTPKELKSEEFKKGERTYRKHT